MQEIFNEKPDSEILEQKGTKIEQEDLKTNYKK